METDKERFARLLERAKFRMAQLAPQANQLQQLMQEKDVQHVDLQSLGISPKTNDDEAADVVAEVISSSPSLTSISAEEMDATPQRASVIGVARAITLNEKQQLFNDTVLQGKSCVLIGAAGTGKTTSMRQVTQNLIDSLILHPLQTGTKHLQAGVPGAAILSFTRKAVNNIRHAVVDQLKPHTLTIHKLLEFSPVFYEIEDPKKPGHFKTTMRFEPTRHAHNPLPKELTFLAFEESSMVSTELYELLQKAMPHEHQEVFLGDIQQLPPIFGMAILGFKMLSLPVVELTEVYRQAAESPIIDLAWKILAGDAEVFNPKIEKFTIYNERLKKNLNRIRVPSLDALSRVVQLDNGDTTAVKFQVWQQSLSVDHALLTVVHQFKAWEAEGYYNPEEDIILCPFNVALGTIEINKGISDFLGKQRGAGVHEVIAGFNKHYLAVGDRVLYDKEDAVITHIRRNGDYLGKTAQFPSVHLDRWGHLDTSRMTDDEKLSLQAAATVSGDLDLEAIDNLMASAVAGAEERVQAASHAIEVRLRYEDEDSTPISLSSASEINNLLGGYCLTVHKFQGSEAEKVFVVLHQSHAVMCQRELLYTAVTRARRHLHIICEKDTFSKGILSQSIKGNTIAEKAEFFKGKLPALEKKKREAAELEGGVRTISGKKAVKLEDLSSRKAKLGVIEILDKLWNYYKQHGRNPWMMGNKPRVLFDIRSYKVLGKANYKRGTIHMNPIWLAMSEENPEMHNPLVRDTLVHEAAHILAARCLKDFGHGPGWKETMLFFDADPERLYHGNLPNGPNFKKEALTRFLFEHGAEEMNEEEIEDTGPTTTQEGEIE